MSEPEAESLRAMTRAGTTEQRPAMRARIILRAPKGRPRRARQELGVSVPTVLLWRRRFKEQGLAGMADAPHPGRPRTSGRWNAGATPSTWVKTADEIVARAVRRTQAESGARHER